MISKILAVATLIAVAQAGVFDLGHHGHATSYSSVSSHDSGYAHAAPVAHVSHVSHAPVAHYSHAAPVAHYSHAAPVAHYSHAAPVAHYSHAAPVAHYSHAAPVAHYSHAAPVAHYSHAPVIKAVHQEVYADSHPHYTYEYGVKDAHTGDDKNAHEERDGDVVKGVYSLVQPDGTTRTVHYTADDHNGFNAQVEYTGHAAHPQVLHKAVVTKAIVAGPAYHSYHH